MSIKFPKIALLQKFSKGCGMDFCIVILIITLCIHKAQRQKYQLTDLKGHVLKLSVQSALLSDKIDVDNLLSAAWKT